MNTILDVPVVFILAVSVVHGGLMAGFLLSPAVGALLMSLSTVIVAINAPFLRRVDLELPSLPSVSVLGRSHPAD